MAYNIGDKIATRDAYGATLVELGNENENLVVLDADLAAATKTGMFKKAHPDRFFDCGIAENNMIGAAVGLSLSGKVPFASTFAMFAAGRSYEQVRNSVGYPHLNVKIAATHAGISVGEDGATHQSIEDLSLMRSIPGMVVINPADSVETFAAVKAAIEHDGPVYLRFGRLATEVIYDENYKFELGKASTVKDGSDVTIIACGMMVAEAIHAADILKNDGIAARVINMHTIKPIDKDAVIKAAKETGAIVTAEEHSIIGGLGSAVAEVTGENCPVPVIRVGVEDKFGKSGVPAELLKEYGLTAENIAKKAKLAISKK